MNNKHHHLVKNSAQYTNKKDTNLTNNKQKQFITRIKKYNKKKQFSITNKSKANTLFLISSKLGSD